MRGHKVVYSVQTYSGKWIRIRSYDSVTRTNTALRTFTSKRPMVLADLTVTPHHVAFSVARTYRTPASGIMGMNRYGHHLTSLARSRPVRLRSLRCRPRPPTPARASPG